jgi:DNA-binding NarL/FixJ family response regulator
MLADKFMTSFPLFQAASSGGVSSGGSMSSNSASSSSGSDASVERTQIFVVDDHPAIREVLASAFEEKEDMDVVGGSATASEALPRIEDLTPNVVVVDISLEQADGLTLIKKVRERVPEAWILVFSMYDENVYAERAIQAGASGYVMKSRPISEIVHAIEEVSQGRVFLSQHIMSRILSKVIRAEEYEEMSPLDELTDRELTVFRLLGEGASVRQIADRLGLARKTIETYRRRAKEKLGHGSIDELVQHAVQWAQGHGESQGKSDDSD